MEHLGRNRSHQTRIKPCLQKAILAPEHMKSKVASAILVTPKRVKRRSLHTSLLQRLSCRTRKITTMGKVRLDQAPMNRGVTLRSLQLAQKLLPLLVEIK